MKFLGSQNCLPDEKMALKKTLPDGNFALKYHYRTGISLSNIITGREFGSQILLQDGNLALKYHNRTGIGLSKIITGRFPSGNDFLKPNSRLVMIFESQIPVR